jgi:uncharacterized protein (DUF608 family)
MADCSPTRREFVASASLLAASAALAGAASSADPSSSADRNAALTRKLTVPTPPSPDWPVLTRYDEAHLTRVAMPIGGIGTGTISIGGRGHLRDFELVNKPAKGYAPPNTFFALYAKTQANGQTMARALEGPVDLIDFEGSSGSPIRNHGLPRFRQCNFAAAYPLAQVLLADPDIPLHVRIEAWNPMEPADTDGSGIPTAVLRFVLINPTEAPIDASVCGTLENFIGWDGDSGKVNKNANDFRKVDGDRLRLRGLFMHSTGLDRNHPAWGTLALATTHGDVTHRTTWAEKSWGDTLLDFWDDFSADGKLEPRESKREAPFGSLAASATVPANGQASVTFLLAWHFPNRLAWNAPHDRIGNYYTTQYADAWDVVQKAAPRLEELERRTVAFVKGVIESDVPDVIKEASLYNASTLRTQTAFRAEDGRFFGWEGCNDHAGCCDGSCTHVWNYEQTTAFLYGSLSRSMREVEFGHSTSDAGLMSFRTHLPLLKAQEQSKAAADGQMGTIMRLYRDWRLSGDDQMLKKLWPHAKKALQFAWIEGGWDADRDGVMEGCQHNTMDVEYFGPNPEMGTWYLGALRAAEEMARHLGETDFADVCRKLFDSGSKWLDANLFNGEYYEHKIVPPNNPESIPKGLRLGAGADNPSEPVLQLGAGCLVDQLVGQYMGHICNLGYLLDRQHVGTTLSSIMKYNWRDNFFGHFNHLRSYALDDDQGLLIATYPKGRRPERPFPYCNEVWTGLEYTAAAGMLFEGHNDDALKVIAAARARHDGRRRNPFDEAECGHHYARAMAAWATLLAWTGFHYDALEQHIRFKSSDEPATWFWSSGNAWGTCRQVPADSSVRFAVNGGQITIAKITVGEKTKTLDKAMTLKSSDSFDAVL